MTATRTMICDLETENYVYHGDLGSPFHPLNYIVAPAFAIDDEPVQSWYFSNREEADASDWFTVPDDVGSFVAHNLQYEMMWLLHRHRDEMMKFLKRGGRVYCTQLAEYILSDQTWMYPKLDEVAPKYGGTHKIDEVKLLWGQGYKTSQIDKDLLLRYLAGPEGDIENTRLTFFAQVEELIKRGLWNVYCIRCEALLYSAFCKFFGMKVDVERANADGAVLADRIADLRPKLLAELPADAPEEVREQFNFNSDFHVSALLYGGPIKYEVQVPYDPPKYVKVDCWQRVDGLFVAVGQDEPGEEFVVYKSGKNKGERKVVSADSDQEKTKKGTALYSFPGVVDLRRLPQGGEDFLGKRAEFRSKRYLADAVVDGAGNVVSGTPVYSSSADALQAILPYTDSVIPKLLVDLADAQKIHGTYYVGMLADVDPEGFLRRGINHVSTVTGRLSSGLQQMPRGERGTAGEFVKAMFVSRFEGGSISEVDYTALEVVHLACLSGDKDLLRYLQAGTDMHCLRLASSMHREYDELVSVNKDKEHPEHELIHNLRQAIKPKSFQFQYGGTAAGIAYKTGCTLEEAQAFIDNELKLFPESSAYRFVIQAAVDKAAESAPIMREQNEYGAWGLYRRATFQGPSGTYYSFRQYTKSVWVAGGDVQTSPACELPVPGRSILGNSDGHRPDHS